MHRRGRVFWERTVAAQARGGLSQVEFAERRDLSVVTLRIGRMRPDFVTVHALGTSGGSGSAGGEAAAGDAYGVGARVDREPPAAEAAGDDGGGARAAEEVGHEVVGA